MAVTIRDVAALAGVSPSTVSRTCKDHPSISKDTKEKVRRAMTQLGYEAPPHTNPQAGQNAQLIGIILPPSCLRKCLLPGSRPWGQPILQWAQICQHRDHRAGRG